jgi:hypothetical protein
MYTVDNVSEYDETSVTSEIKQDEGDGLKKFVRFSEALFILTNFLSGLALVIPAAILFSDTMSLSGSPFGMFCLALLVPLFITTFVLGITVFFSLNKNRLGQLPFYKLRKWNALGYPLSFVIIFVSSYGSMFIFQATKVSFFDPEYIVVTVLLLPVIAWFLNIAVAAILISNGLYSLSKKS